MTPMRRMMVLTPLIVFVATVLLFGASFEGFSQLQHPVALLGGAGIAGATAFNLLGFVMPGAIAACIAYDLRSRLPPDSAWPARIGAWLALLSALAFAAQGLFPLDPADLDAPASRWHYLAWMLWWIAFVPAGLLLATGLHGTRGWRAFAGASLAGALLIAVCAILPADFLPAAVSQRIGFVAWLSWLALWPDERHR